MTTAAFATRLRLSEQTWPTHVQARNRSFLRAALRVQPARKHNLAVAITDVLNRGNLLLHATGGLRTPRRGRLAIPTWTIAYNRGPRGIRKNLLPRAIVDNTPRRALRITERGIFVGEGGRLHLKYSFHANAHIRRDVPFYEDFERFMVQEIEKAFPAAFERAMSTRR
jgi:hypothetical protein